MKQILLLGAGKIGAIITEMLATCGDYELTIVDASQENLDRVASYDTVSKVVADITSDQELNQLMEGKFAVLSALPFHLTGRVATIAVKHKVHYLDLTEDVECTKNVKKLAESAECALIPQCGLAPGFITIAANDLAKKFDSLNNVNMRVGALPKYPANALKYNLTWSTAGLINEYCNPCEAIVDGKLTAVSPLEELETFCLDGVTYEAFNTSGGLGTFCETLAGKVHNLNYRSVRYPGHRDIMKLLLQDLRLQERQDLLIEIFENALPKVTQDVVLVFVNVNGMRDGQLIEENYANKIYSQEINGKHWSAIQVTTASGICTVLDLLAHGKTANKGLIRQEDISLDDFIANRFGQYYQVSA
ncbi:MAG: saccharopine dehydrogenase family protein [Arenicella sp.]